MIDMGRQWEDRLRIWSEQFEKQYFRKYRSLAVEYFSTLERLPLARAEAALLELEQKLGCVARAKRQQQALQTICRAVGALEAIPQARELAHTILTAAEDMKE